uniref:Uncharacterized protein n=1 Tax=Cacopsylla melanoneura TaxID=428564 RepID=A0A8D8SBZ8_9HEMI
MYVTRSFVNTASVRQNPNRDSQVIYLTVILTFQQTPSCRSRSFSETARTPPPVSRLPSSSRSHPPPTPLGSPVRRVVRPLLQVQGWSHKSHEGSIVQRRSSKPDNIAPMNVQLHVCVHYYDVPRRTYLGLKGRYDHIGLMNILPSCFSYVQIQIRG